MHPPRNNIDLIYTNDIFIDSILFHNLGELYYILYKRINKFPKPDRYKIGIKLENTLLELIETLFLAQSKTGKAEVLLLNKADIHLKLFKMFLRIANKNKSLPDTGYIEISEKSIEVGKIIGGWIKNTKPEK